MNEAELRSRDAVVLDGFEWPSALREAATPDARPVRVSRQRGSAFATVTLLASGCERETSPISVTIGDNQSTFGKARNRVLTITSHGARSEQLIAMLRNAADALQSASEVAEKLDPR